MQPEESLNVFPTAHGAEVIQKAPIFAKLGFEETNQLASIAQVERFSRGRLMVEQDSLGQALYIIRDGTMGVYHRDPSGARELLGQLGPGELFGEMSLIDDLLVSADVEVLSESAEVVIIPRAEFEVLLAGNLELTAKVYKSFCRVLSDRLRKTNLRVAESGRRPHE